MIFADSSFFIAIAREKDRWHEDALRIAEKIKEPVLISELIISETITMIGSFEGGLEKSFTNTLETTVK